MHIWLSIYNVAVWHCCVSYVLRVTSCFSSFARTHFVLKSTVPPLRAHVCCLSDVRAEHGMERNIGDQLNKAFEAYRQVSIEKDNVKKELQQKVTAGCSTCKSR